MRTQESQPRSRPRSPDRLLVTTRAITARRAFPTTDDPQQWHEVIDTKPDRRVQLEPTHVWPGMRERKFRRVIIISSINGQESQFAKVKLCRIPKAGRLGVSLKSLCPRKAALRESRNAIVRAYIATDMVMARAGESARKHIAQIPAGRLGLTPPRKKKGKDCPLAWSSLPADDSGFLIKRVRPFPAKRGRSFSSELTTRAIQGPVQVARGFFHVFNATYVRFRTEYRHDACFLRVSQRQ